MTPPASPWAILPAAVLLLAAAAAAQKPTVIHQSTTGWCSPVIANVTGNVTVNCIGVDPRALTRLNAQLAKKNQELNASIAEANQWVERYQELDAQLKAAGANSELSKQAQEYVHQGDFEKAREILDRLLKQDASEQNRIATDYFQRGLISQLEFKPLEALHDLERAYLLNPDNLRFALKFSQELQNEHEYARAEPVLNDALQRARASIAKDPTKNRATFAWLLYGRAGILRETNRFKEAENDYLEALAAFRDLAKEKPAAYQPDVSFVLMDLGLLYQDLHRTDEAETLFKESLAIDRSLPPSDQQRAGLSISLSNLSTLYLRRGQDSQALQLQDDVVATWRELAKSSPSINEPSLAQALNNLAAMNQANGHLPEAERAAVEATEIISRAAATNPKAHRPMQAQAFTTLADIYNSEHRYPDAELNFQKALTIARQLVAESPQAFNTQLANILSEMASDYRRMGKPTESADAANEALDLYRGLAATNPDAFEEKRASVASGLGMLYLSQQDAASATRLLSESADAYRRLVATKPSQHDPHLAVSLQELALALLSQKDLARAKKAADESVAIFSRLRSASAPFNHESMARSLLMDAGLTERENFTRSCSMAGEAAEIATDAATRQSAQQAFDNCRRNRNYRQAR